MFLKYLTVFLGILCCGGYIFNSKCILFMTLLGKMVFVQGKVKYYIWHPVNGF